MVWTEQKQKILRGGGKNKQKNCTKKMFMTLYRRKGSRPSPWKKKMQKSKMAVWGGLTNSCEKKRREKQRRKGKIEASECRAPKNSKER